MTITPDPIEQLKIDGSFQVTHAFYNPDDDRDIPKVGLKGKLLGDEITINVNPADPKAKGYMAGHDHARATKAIEQTGKSKPLPNSTLQKIIAGEIKIVKAPNNVVTEIDVLEIHTHGHLKGGIQRMQDALEKFKIVKMRDTVPWYSEKDSDGTFKMAFEGVMSKKDTQQH
ncbi:MAG: hypothetical protein GY804_05085 [Alphaproteobacteria bacterium]|nr:hypothetical protein [Alphaproteobacteria bacterium]